MGNYSLFRSESQIRVDDAALKRAAIAARGRSAEWLRDLESYYDDGAKKFSFRFFDQSEFFFYPGSHRSLVLRVLERCLVRPSGAKRGVARFDIDEGSIGEVVVDYVSQSISLRTRQGRGPWKTEADSPISIPAPVLTALAEKGSGRSAKTSTAFKEGRAYGFQRGSETIWIGFRHRVFYKWTRKPREQYLSLRREALNSGVVSPFKEMNFRKMTPAQRSPVLKKMREVARRAARLWFDQAAARLLSKKFERVEDRAFFSDRAVHRKRSKYVFRSKSPA